MEINTMKKILLFLTMGILVAEIPNDFEKNNLLNTAMDSTLSSQDSLMYPHPNKVKYPGKAMIFSGIVPGLGELYNGNWKRALLFAGIEVASWSTWYYYNKQGDDQTILFEQYADEHWDFKNWVTDYDEWDDEDSEYRILFEKISTFGEISDTTYEAIYEGSHSISFYYDGGWHSTTDEYFEENYEDFDLDSVSVLRDDPYYENIGKYNHFFAGWDDNDSLSIYDNDGYLVAKSPNKWKYRDMRKQANDFMSISGYAVSAVLLNHVASMIDAVFVTRESNSRDEQNFSARLKYNPKNKYGIGGLEVSFKW